MGGGGGGGGGEQEPGASDGDCESGPGRCVGMWGVGGGGGQGVCVEIVCVECAFLQCM